MGRMRVYPFTLICILLDYVSPNILGNLKEFVAEIFQDFAYPRDFALLRE